MTTREIVTAIEMAVPEVAGRVTFDYTQLPFPPRVSVETDGSLELLPDTPLAEGVRLTIERFRSYLAENPPTGYERRWSLYAAGDIPVTRRSRGNCCHHACATSRSSLR